MAIAMKAGGFGGGSGGGMNETLPPMVQNLSAKVNDKLIALTWQNPKSDHLAGVLVVYNDAKMPENPMDGETVDAKLANTVTLNGLTNDVEYFIRVFPYNKSEQYQTLLDGATVTATPVAISRTLNENSWEVIANVAKYGEGANYWKLGDAKETSITGSVDGYDFTGSHFPFIIGFNHNEAVEGKGIHFSFGKSQLTGGKDVAYQGFKMNDTNTNAGGWKGSKMFKTCESFYGILPDELKTVIVPCTKWTNNVGGSDAPSNVTATQEKVWLMAEFEVFGKRTYANSTEQAKQKQYEYYANGNSKIRYDFKSNGNAVYTWLRSALYSADNSFCLAYTNGDSGLDRASNPYAFVPCFKLGLTGISPVLNDSSWDVISDVAKSGNGANIWKVGDAKEVELTGTVDGYDFTGKHYPFILGFNHNEEIEGKGIHFSFGKSALDGGKDIAYNGFKMNDTNTNVGGWKGSKMYQTCNKFFDVLPEVLKKNIVACTKYTDNKGGAEKESNVTATQDKIFLPAEFEFFGKRTFSNTYEQSHQKQYEYYKAASKVRYDFKSNGSKVYVWSRSPNAGLETAFCYVHTNGDASCDNAAVVLAFAPCFKLGSDPVSSTLNDNSWETISKIAKEGNGASYWKVGDCKEVEINGTVGSYQFSGKYYPFILGFNHNEALEGKNIHFSFGKSALTSGKDVAFNRFYMGSSRNGGGWEYCRIKTDFAPPFFSILPQALKSVIIPCRKYTDNEGNASNVASTVTETFDNIWILAEFEIFGSRKYANQYEQNKQKQYSYYANGNSKIRYDAKSPGTAIDIWLRSADYSSNSSFCCVYSGGTSGSDNVSLKMGFTPCFALGSPAV